MTTRRSRGESSLFWHKGRRRQISGKTKTEAKAKLLHARRDRADGLPEESRTYTVGDAVESWLAFGLAGKAPSTISNRRIQAELHILPTLGPRRLSDLTTCEVDRWLQEQTELLSTDSIKRLLSILRRLIARAQAQDLVAGMSRSCASRPMAGRVDHRSL